MFNKPFSFFSRQKSHRSCTIDEEGDEDGRQKALTDDRLATSADVIGATDSRTMFLKTLHIRHLLPKNVYILYILVKLFIVTLL